MILVLSVCTPDNTVISSDGVTICYHVQGKGKPALVFIHGWCCDKSYWDLQVAYFADRYKVVAIDLAGHGESGLNRSDWTLAAFGEDVVAVVKKLRLDRVLLIGHSMGGPVALETARRMPERVVGIVGADTFNNVDINLTQQQIDQYVNPFRSNFSEAMSTVVRIMFVPGSDSALVEKIVADMSAAPPEVGLGALEAVLDYINNDLTQAIQDVQAPIRCINSDMHINSNVEECKRFASSFEVSFMSGVGHFLMLEDPETFNRHLEKYIEDFIH